MKHKLFLSLLTLSTLFLTACDNPLFPASPKERSLEWTEEVQLANGKVIKVKRYLNGTVVTSYDHGKNALLHTKANTVEVIDTAQLGNPPPIWSDIWDPLIIDQGKDGLWFMVVTPNLCEDWNSFYKFRQYKAINGQWQQVEFEIDQLNGRTPNLETETSHKVISSEYLPLSKKTLNIYEAIHAKIKPFSKTLCGQTPCVRDQQGKLKCGWNTLCPKEQNNPEWFKKWQKCVDHYEQNVFTPKFMKSSTN